MNELHLFSRFQEGKRALFKSQNEESTKRRWGNMFSLSFICSLVDNQLIQVEMKLASFSQTQSQASIHPRISKNLGSTPFCLFSNSFWNQLSWSMGSFDLSLKHQNSISIQSFGSSVDSHWNSLSILTWIIIQFILPHFHLLFRSSFNDGWRATKPGSFESFQQFLYLFPDFLYFTFELSDVGQLAKMLGLDKSHSLRKAGNFYIQLGILKMTCDANKHKGNHYELSGNRLPLWRCASGHWHPP